MGLNHRRILPVTLTLIAALMLGCTTQQRSPAGALPTLPGLGADRREPAVIQTSSVNGADTVDRSAGTQVQGTSLQLDAGAGALEWAIWSFAPAAGTTPISASFNFTVASGAQVWIGVADYVGGTWRLDGPHPSAATAVIGALSAGNLSPAGNLYLLVAAYDATVATVSRLDLEVDVPVQQKFFIGGTLSHSVLGALPNKVLTLQPGGAQAITSPNGAYNFPDLLPGDYTVIPPQLEGVTVSPPQGDVTIINSNVTNVHFSAVPPTEQITYKTHIKFLFDAKCVHCHGSEVQWNNIRLDSYLRPDNNDAWHHAEIAMERVKTEGGCPTDAPPLHISQRLLIEDWVKVYEKREEPLP